MHPRFIEPRIQTSLSDTRVVLLSGPRQSGKSTLAQHLADDGRPFFTLDDATTLAAVQRDPTGFIRGLDHAVIDEIQRAPELLLAIKQSVDTDRRPGRFLLTGSANLMTLPRVADSLAGRMATIDLLPLSPAELRGTPSTFRNRITATAQASGASSAHSSPMAGSPSSTAPPGYHRHRGAAIPPPPSTKI